MREGVRVRDTVEEEMNRDIRNGAKDRDAGRGPGYGYGWCGSGLRERDHEAPSGTRGRNGGEEERGVLDLRLEMKHFQSRQSEAGESKNSAHRNQR